MKEIHPVQWPQTGSYKVVQLEIRGAPVLVFGDTGLYHASILGKYLLGQEIDFEFERSKNHAPRPKKEGTNYIMVGAGDAEVREVDKSIFFHGSSVGYDIPINREHIEKVGKPSPEWTVDVAVSMI